MTPRSLNRLKLIGIGALAAAPVIASYLLYWFWYPERSMNYGALLEPRQLPSIELRTADAEPFTLDQLRGRWVLLTVDRGACGTSCQHKLWIMRQIRQAQGKDADRIERIWLIDDDAPLPTHIAQDYRGTWALRDRARALIALLPAEGSVDEHVYLVDPLGNLMLRFPANPQPKRMITDLKRLLRYSRTG